MTYDQVRAWVAALRAQRVAVPCHLGLGTSTQEGGWGYTDTPIGRCVEAGGLWNEEQQYCMPAPSLVSGSSGSGVPLWVYIAAGSVGYLAIRAWWKKRK